MKTKFIKKLSFVLVVAMVLSLLVPATGAFAASAKLNSTKKYLHLGREESGENEFNFNVKNKKSGWKYKWESLNEDVVEVNSKNGVATATGVGKTKVVLVITDKNNEEVAELKATVTVRDNIASVAVKNPVENLKVNEEHDYNRSFETESGSTKKTDSITRWTVEPADKATIDDKGVFVATEAGEFTVTALSFQSIARYDAWDDDAEKYADYVLATAETKVVVGASMVEAKQVSLNKLAVTFDSAVVKADLDKNLKVSYLAGTTKVAHQFKEIKMDEANKVATVELYGDHVKNTTYVVDLEGMESVQYVSATVKHTDVVRAELLTKTAQVGVPEELKIALYDKNDVNIANNDLVNRVEWKTSSNTTYLTGKMLSMYKVDETTTLTAIYHTYEYDTTTGLEVGAVTVEGIVSCVEQKTDAAGLLNAYTVVKKVAAVKDANFGDVKHSVAAGDADLYLAVQLKGKYANGWQDLYTDNKVSDTDFEYVSSNSDILIVDKLTGSVYPVREGQATVVVSYKKNVVGSALITIVGARKVASVTVSAPSFTLSNHAAVDDFKELEIKIKDQLGDNYPLANVDITTEVNGNVADGGLLDVTTIKSDKPMFKAISIPEKTYTYTITVKDKANGWASTSRYVAVTVAKANSDDPYRYAIETDKSEYDMNVRSWDETENVAIALFGYAPNGVRNLRVPLTGSDVLLTVYSPNGGTKYGNMVSGSVTAPNVITPVSGIMTLELIKQEGDDKNSSNTIYAKKSTGTYILEATNMAGVAINRTYFTVKDDQAVPTFKVNKLYTDKINVVDAINDCFDFNIGGTDLQVGANTDAKVVSGQTSKSVYVDKVYVYQEIVTGVFVRHEVKVNTVIHYAQ